MSKKKGKRHPGRKGRKGGHGPNVFNFKGKKTLTLSSTNSDGSIKIYGSPTPGYDLDTNFVTEWATFANMYQFWKIKHLKFHYVPNVSYTTPGSLVMGVIEDVDNTTPTTLEGILLNRCSNMGPIKETLKLSYKPQSITKWFFTKDNVTSIDRLEFPGEFYVASINCSSDFNPGLIIINYWVQFKDITNSSVQAMAKELVDKKEEIKNLLEKVGTSPKPIQKLEIELPIPGGYHRINSEALTPPQIEGLKRLGLYKYAQVDQ